MVEEIKIDRYKLNFIHEKKRILLEDGAGMGKSTLVKFLMTKAIENIITVPVLLELRNISSDKSIIDIMVAEFNKYGSDNGNLTVDKDFLIKNLERGDFTFFLDGYDEIDPKYKENITSGIKKFIDSYPSNRYLITSRPDHSIPSFSSFSVYSIKSLDLSDAYELIKKYDKYGERSQRLIEELDRKDSSINEVRDYLKNPLLTTLLYRAYEHKNQIPLKKHLFYRQVYDALYEWHDLTKDGFNSRKKISGLDIDGFHKILRGMGFYSVLKGRVEGGKDDVLEWVRISKKYSPELKFSESAFLEDIIMAVPIFRRDGDKYYWAHKSLAEYFAASFLSYDAKKDQEKICRRFYEDNLIERKNLLDLLYDIDVNLFNKFYTKKLIDFYNEELRKNIENYPGIPLKYIEKRTAVFLGIIALAGDGKNPKN